MKELNIDLNGIKTNKIVADIPGYNFLLEFVYNKIDDNIYIAILDTEGNYKLGHTRLVRIIDYFSLTRELGNYGVQLRLLKINEFSNSDDKVNVENFSRDYKLFIIER